MKKLLLPAVVVALVSPLSAQWAPPSGQWGKIDPADLRMMTWNVRDGICSTNAKVEGANNWCALARIVASMKPDVLLLQECGDNSGNGSGTSIDSVADLITTVGYFLHGGNDSFHGGSPVTAYVQKYAPGFDMTNVFVTNSNDGFNRNVILSRYAFADLNGDGRSTIDDIPSVTPTLYAPGGGGGIRGFQFVEIALPHATYTGNLVVGNAHLKSGSTSSDIAQRIAAAENVAYVIQYWWNGNFGTVPDPMNKIADVPPATSVLGPDTPVVLGGDWNEDEQTDGIQGPAAWLTQAAVAGGTSDGTDRDGSDMTYDSSVNFFSGSRDTEGGSKLDYVAWQDSIVALRLSTVFNSAANPASAQPPELAGFPNPATASGIASDHRPVIADLRLPVVDCNHNGVADTTDIANGTSQDLDGNQVPDECECTIASYCSSSANSSGNPAVISSSGSTSIAANDFVLLCNGCPPNKLGLFLYGTVQTDVAFGNGRRCVGNPFHRLPTLTTDGAGHASFAVDYAHLPAGGQITAGSAWNFQFWFRDPPAGGALFDLSNGLAAGFCP